MKQNFFLSESAAKRIASLIAKRNDPSISLRISVEGGGCSGFQYKYEFVTDLPNEDELIIEQEGAKILIDLISLDLLNGSTLDFNEDLSGSYFKMKNPNASNKCGCGNSFSV